MMYYIFPRIYKTKLYSTSLANWHFWLMTLGVLVYVIPMYWGGITQALMWKQFNAEGYLQYPNFLETVVEIIPMYMIRAIGGVMFLIGAVMMGFGAMLAGGCAVGAGVSGGAILSLTAWLAVAAMWVGALATIHVTRIKDTRVGLA